MYYKRLQDCIDKRINEIATAFGEPLNDALEIYKKTLQDIEKNSKVYSESISRRMVEAYYTTVDYIVEKGMNNCCMRDLFVQYSNYKTPILTLKKSA